MAKVFTITPGLVLSIGNFGEASNEVPCTVPDEVAALLEEEIAGERPNPDFGKPVPDGQAPHPRTVKIARGPRTDIRVERDTPASPAAKASAAPKHAPRGDKKEE
jgi:hypothetical protein